jgi:signal transduction histidine kinase
MPTAGPVEYSLRLNQRGEVLGVSEPVADWLALQPGGTLRLKGMSEATADGAQGPGQRARITPEPVRGIDGPEGRTSDEPDSPGLWPNAISPQIQPTTGFPLEQLLYWRDAERVRKALAGDVGAPLEWLSEGQGALVGEEWLLWLGRDASQSVAPAYRLTMRDLGPAMRASRRRERLDSLWDMAAGVAHEFNNRLTAALGNSFRLRARLGANSLALQPLERLEDALLAMDRLTGQLLQFTAFGGQEPRLADLNAWLDAQRDAIEARVPTGVSLEWQLVRTPLLVRIDGDALSQALLALIDNAIEAMVRGRGSLRLSVAVMEQHEVSALAPAWLQAESTSYARICLVDDGCGIAEDMLDRAVEPFVSSRQPGRGLGLSVVLGIAQRHNGGMHIRRCHPRGTEVMLFLPLADALSSPSAQDLHIASQKGD